MNVMDAIYHRRVISGFTAAAEDDEAIRLVIAAAIQALSVLARAMRR